MKSTKKSLVLSMLSLLLCITMLISTTFAWFTDSVTSGSNRIVAGNLDVDMLYKSGTMADYATVNGVTNNGDGTTPIFVDKDGGKILWEPGAMVYTYFKVENLGTLAFQYNFALQITGMNALETSGVKHNLSEVVKAVVLNGEVEGSSIKETVADKTFNSVESFEDRGSMLPENEKYFTVVLYWEPTDNDNLYNVNNGKTTTQYGSWTNEDTAALYIDFDVKLTATQVPYEEDSFDKFYDNIELGLIPASWSGESEEADYNNGGFYSVVVEDDTKATVQVPAGAEDEDGNALAAADKLKLVVSAGSDASVKVETGNSITTYDVSLVRVSDNKKVQSDTPMKVTLDIGYLDLVRFYHDGVEYENRKTTADEVTAVGDFYYDVTTGVVTFMANHFSPFSPVYKFSGGLGTEAHPYLIANTEQFQKMTTYNKYYELTADIDLDEAEIISSNTYGFDSIVNRFVNSIINGADHKITYSGNAESIFGDFCNSTVKNMKMDIDCPISGYLRNGVFDTLTVDGDMQFSNNTGLFGYYCYVAATAKDCTINVNVTSTSYSALMFGYCLAATNYTVTGGSYNGTYVGPYASLVIGNPCYKVNTVTITNFLNNGTIRQTLMNNSANNPFISMNGDGQGNKTTVNYNGTSFTNEPANATANSMILEGSGQYICGPADSGLAITANADKTLTFTKSQFDTVSYYEIDIVSNVTHVGAGGGSGNISVSEQITADGSASYTTALKCLRFADATVEEATYQIGQYNVITKEGTDYYVNSNTAEYMAGTGARGAILYIRAYNANNQLVSSTAYTY